MSNLEQAVDISVNMATLATRWVRGWYGSAYTGYDYYGATRVRLCPLSKRIYFTAQIRDGMSWEQSLDGKYLDNDSTLEADAEAWYKAEQAARLEKLDRRRVLENTPEVQEYQRMINTSPYGGIYGFSSRIIQ